MKNIYLVLLLALTVVSCKKEVTTWESDWNAPVINDTLSLANLVNDSTLSVSSGYYSLDLSRSLFDLSISDLVSIPDTTIVKNYTSAINLNVPPNTTFAGSVETYELELGDLQLKKVTLRNGYIDVRVENPIETKTYFLIKLPGVTKNGTPFQHLMAAPPASASSPGVLEETIDLSGYTLDLTGEFGGSYNELLADFSVTTDPAGDTTFLANSDVTRVEAKLRDASVYYAQGYFGNMLISDTTTVDLSVLDVYQSGLLDIGNLNLSFEVENGVKVGAITSLLTVANENSLGNTVALAGSNIGTTITVSPAVGSWGTLTPSLTTLDFNSSNSNIEAYVENLGKSHKVGYTFQVNPWGNVSGGWDQIFPNSRIRVNLKAQMPLSLGMNNLVLQDTFDISLNQDPTKTKILSGSLILNAKNGFPFNADVSLYLLDANGNVLHTVDGSDLIESSQYGTFDAQSGILVQPSKVTFTLNEAAVADANEVTRVIVRARFNSPDPVSGTSQSYLIPENAFLGIKLKTNFKTENIF